MIALLIAGVGVAAALAAVLASNIVRRVLALGLLIVTSSALLFEMGGEMLAVIQLLLYAGGVVALFGFAVGRLGRGGEGGATALHNPMGAGIVALAVVGTAWSVPWPADSAGFDRAVDIQLSTLLAERMPAFEGVGIVVLAVLVAALALIRNWDRDGERV